MEKLVNIGGTDYRMKCTALLPRQYRFKFGRDLVQDMSALTKNYNKAVTDEAEQLSAVDLTIFENVAFLMVKSGSADIPDTPEEWLDSIDGIFSVYEALPAVLELWQFGQATTAKSKKK